ncbi:MAG: hypothetical protein ACLTTH_06530 [Holdemanella porci]
MKNLEIIGLNMWGFDVSKNTNLKSLTADTHYTWYNIGNNPNLETVNVGNTRHLDSQQKKITSILKIYVKE